MKTDTDIEELLMSGKKLSLSTHEKALIKSTLLEHASETLKHETRAVPSPWTSWMLRSSVSFASLLLVFMGTAYASHDSLPGEPLYAVKVHVVEEVIGLTKTTPEDRIAYDIQLMETRLEEIKEITMHPPETIPENLDMLTSQIDQHVTDVTATLADTQSNHISHSEKIKVLTKLSGVTKAQAKIAKENPELTEIAATIDGAQDITSDTLTITVDAFIASEPEAVVRTYLSDQITDIEAYVIASTTDVSTRNAIEDHLHNVGEALIENDITEAVNAILTAQQELHSEEYVHEEMVSETETSHTTEESLE